MYKNRNFYNNNNGDISYCRCVREKNIYLILLRYTNLDSKISLYVCVHVKTMPWEICILNPKNPRKV